MNKMKDSLPDLQVGNITHTNMLATVRLVAQFCVAVHKEYQCLRREVRALRAENHSLLERISQNSCSATGDAPRFGKLPENGARKRSDTEFSENNDSFVSSGTNSGGADENIPPHIDNEADASESGTEAEILADVHVDGASKSTGTESSMHANAADNDSSDRSVDESQPHEKTSSTKKKSVGRTVRIAPSGPRAKRRLLENHADSDKDKFNANDGDSVINKVCQEISKTFEDGEQSNSSGSSFDKWSPEFKILKETPTSRGSPAAKRRSKERENAGHSGSDAKLGRKTKLNSASKAARSATKSCDTRKSKLDSSHEAESSGNSDVETEVAERGKSASSSGKLLKRLSNSETTKSKGFLRIKMSNRNSNQKATRKKVVGPRKRKSLPDRKLNGNASDSDNQDDTDDDDDISPLAVFAAKKRSKLNQKQKFPQPLPQDLGDESDLGGVVKLWDAGYAWQLSELMTQMLDEGGAKSLTFAAAKITNHTRARLAEKLCWRASFKWDADRRIIKRQHSSRPPGANDMEKVLH